MYTEAFLFVGNLLQTGLIKRVKFGKNYFKVKFKDSKKFVPYEYSQNDILVFLQDIEEIEKRN